MLNRVFRPLRNEYDTLNDLYKFYKRSFLNETEHLQLTPEALLDIYQDSVVATYQKYGVEQIRKENSDLKAFLFGVCWGKIEETLNGPSLAEISAGRYTIIKLNNTELSPQQIKLEKHFLALSENVQRIFKLYYHDNLGDARIADKTKNKDEKTVETLRTRGLKRLISQIKT